jgi:hypothetical protein
MFSWQWASILWSSGKWSSVDKYQIKGITSDNIAILKSTISCHSGSFLRNLNYPPFCCIWGSHSIDYEENYALRCTVPSFLLVTCLADSSTLKMEALCPSETSVNFYRTTQRHIPDDSCFNVIFYLFTVFRFTLWHLEQLRRYIVKILCHLMS